MGRLIIILIKNFEILLRKINFLSINTNVFLGILIFGIDYHLTEVRINSSGMVNRRNICTLQFIFSSEWHSAVSQAE